VQKIALVLTKFNRNCCHRYSPNGLSAGASPQTLLESLQRSPDPIAVFRGPIGGEGKRREEKGRKGKGRGGKRSEGM